MEYYIFVSNASNLNSEYCSVLIGSNQNGISTPTYKLESLFTYFEKTQEKLDDNKVDIIFLGVETTLDFKYIISFMNFQKDYTSNLEFHYMLHINGLLLSIIPYSILANLESILLTINCSNITIYELKERVFENIVNAIYKVKSTKNILIIGKFMISKEPSLYNEIMLFHPFFDSICWQIENTENFYNFNSFYKSYKNNVTLLMELWMKYLQEGVVLKFIPFISNVCFLNNCKFPISLCCGQYNQIVYIQTDGTCYTCAENTLTINNIDKETSEKIVFDKFSFNEIECRSCRYIKICKGCCGKMFCRCAQSHIKEHCQLNKIQFDYFEDNIDSINAACNMHHISLAFSNSIYHFSD